LKKGKRGTKGTPLPLPGREGGKTPGDIVKEGERERNGTAFKLEDKKKKKEKRRPTQRAEREERRGG